MYSVSCIKFFQPSFEAKRTPSLIIGSWWIIVCQNYITKQRSWPSCDCYWLKLPHLCFKSGSCSDCKCNAEVNIWLDIWLICTIWAAIRLNFVQLFANFTKCKLKIMELTVFYFNDSWIHSLNHSKYACMNSVVQRKLVSFFLTIMFLFHLLLKVNNAPVHSFIIRLKLISFNLAAVM